MEGRRGPDEEEGGIPAALHQTRAACSLHLVLKTHTPENMLHVPLVRCGGGGPNDPWSRAL